MTEKEYGSEHRRNKHSYTDSTVLATAWEDRQLPDPKETVE